MATVSADRAPEDVTPSARRLTGSLRDIGYNFQSALADIVDNSVAAGATQVDLEICFDGHASYISIADNGSGMAEKALLEAMRFGTRRGYDLGELGRYGLGLKTASISQCRMMTVVSRQSKVKNRTHSFTLDLDHIERTDRWEIIETPASSAAHLVADVLDGGPGTIVLWENLDRLLGPKPESGGARRRLNTLEQRARQYLGMVFHRFLEGTALRTDPLTITINEEKVAPWNPFAPLEEARIELPPLSFEVPAGKHVSQVHLQRYVLPPKGSFSTVAEFERLSGPLKWNRQQGIYVYRADRLIQSGGWAGIRAVDEHTKFARATLDFQTDLDELFQINVAKMRVSIPPEVRTMLERPVHELCHRADAAYRGDARNRPEAAKPAPSGSDVSDARELGAALVTAALSAGETESFMKVMTNLRTDHPELARALGW